MYLIGINLDLVIDCFKQYYYALILRLFLQMADSCTEQCDFNSTLLPLCNVENKSCLKQGITIKTYVSCTPW